MILSSLDSIEEAQCSLDINFGIPDSQNQIFSSFVFTRNTIIEKQKKIKLFM